MQALTSYSVCALRRLLETGEVSAVEAARAYLDAIAQTDGAIGAYLTVTADRALEQAASVDRRRAAGEPLGTLAGIPAGVKDNICTKGVPTTCASRMLEHFVPPYDAGALERMPDVVVLGKTNLDEFAMGSTTENSCFHPTRNPRDPGRVPGGSSGGSAAAVAAGEAAFALGSDTGGSIRQPAAFCGCVGMKPTYGAVSRYGLVAFASSLDQIGPLTRDVADCAAVLTALVGHDRRDATSVERSDEDYAAAVGQDVKGLRVGLPKEYFGEGLSPEIRGAVYAAARAYEALGAQIVELSMPDVGAALPAYYVISSAEASSNLARFDGVKYGYRSERYENIGDLICNSRSEGFGSEVKRRILLGTYVLSAGYYEAYYQKALQVRTLLVRAFDQAFAQCDALLSPVAPTTAYPLGEKRGDPLAMYMGDVYTVPVNIAGLPALSLPVGRDAAGLPIGAQLIGRAFGESTLLRLGAALERQMGGACK